MVCEPSPYGNRRLVRSATACYGFRYSRRSVEGARVQFSDRDVRRRFEGFFDLVRDAQRFFPSGQRPHGQAMITTARMRALIE
jgi:hypothetical protein